MKSIDKELDKNPYIFIERVLYIDQGLEKSDSWKKYQVIPIRTNFTPKFIPINVHSFVDMLDSKYLLKQIKNYYHDQTDRGQERWWKMIWRKKRKANKEKNDKINEETHVEAEKLKINYDNSLEKSTKKHGEDIIKIKNESQKN